MVNGTAVGIFRAYPASAAAVNRRKVHQVEELNLWWRSALTICKQAKIRQLSAGRPLGRFYLADWGYGFDTVSPRQPAAT